MIVKLATEKEKHKTNVGGMALAGGVLGAGAGHAFGPGIVEGVGTDKLNKVMGHFDTVKDIVHNSPNLANQAASFLDGTTLGNAAAGQGELLADLRVAREHAKGNTKAYVSRDAAPAKSIAGKYKRSSGKTTSQLGAQFTNSSIENKLKASAERITAAEEGANARRAFRSIARDTGTAKAGRQLRAFARGAKSEVNIIDNLLGHVRGLVKGVGEHRVNSAVQKAEHASPLIGGLLGMGILGGGAALSNMSSDKE